MTDSNENGWLEYDKMRAEIRTLKADLAAERERRERAEAAVERFRDGHPCPACEQDMSLCCPEHMTSYVARVVEERDAARAPEPKGDGETS